MHVHVVGDDSQSFDVASLISSVRKECFIVTNIDWTFPNCSDSPAYVPFQIVDLNVKKIK